MHINWEKISQLQRADIERIRMSLLERAKKLSFKDGSLNENYINAEIAALNDLYEIFGGQA